MTMRNGGRFASLLLGAGALWWLAHQGVFPERNPLRPKEYLIWEHDLDRHGWANLLNRRDVIICLTWFFVTTGPTTTLPADFNVNSNQVNCIGTGAPGLSAPLAGHGAVGGAGGGFSQIANYAGHSAGQVVNVQVGVGDTWFDSTSIVLAKAAAGATGGQASAGVGTTTFSGGNAAIGGNSNASSGAGGGGGGGGGAGGPNGNGNNGANGSDATITTAGDGGAGGTADAGLGGAGGSVTLGNGQPGGNGGNGSEFDATHGSGGAGAGGEGNSGSGTGGNGGNAGSYGGGGGGAGGGGSTGVNGNGGNAFQGLIAIAYTPSSGGARSFGFILS